LRIFNNLAKEFLINMGSSEGEKFNALLECADLFGRQIDYQEILRLMISRAISLFDAETASVVMINPKTQHTVKTIMRSGRENGMPGLQLLQTNVVGWVNTHRQPFLSCDVTTDSRFTKHLFSECAAGPMMCVEMHNQGICIGFLTVVNGKTGRRFDAGDLSLFQKYAALCAPFLGNAQKIEDYFTSVLSDSSLPAKYEPLGLIGKSRPFLDLLKAVESAARCDVRVLLEGQSGTGKELIARAIHQFSKRGQHPFIAVDCGAIHENLVESELFGHVRGAFTGAARDRKGLFEEADGGTLFIDEIENLPLAMQSKLLRVVQEGEIRIVGSNQARKVDVRIITASSAMLWDRVSRQTFREDLYYRLYVYPIRVPSLNERAEDIPVLANHFLKRSAGRQGKKVESFGRPILEFMQRRSWKGNIRELENFVERMVTLADPERKVIDQEFLPAEYRAELREMVSIPSVWSSLEEDLADYEKRLIRRTLEETGWNQSKAARILKISERTMRYKLEKLGIKRL